MKCVIFSNFLDFENGYRYLNTFECKEKKTHTGFLLVCLSIGITLLI